jgi:hypothetical protein
VFRGGMVSDGKCLVEMAKDHIRRLAVGVRGVKPFVSAS